MDARTDEIILPWYPQTAIGGAGADQDGVGAVLVPWVRRDSKVPIVLRDLSDADGGEQFDIITSSLGDDPVRQLPSSDPLREARVVVYALGCPCLAAQGALFDDQAIDPLSGSIDGGGQASGAPADDYKVVERALSLEPKAQFARQLIIRGF